MKKAITVCALLIFSLAMGENKANASIFYDDFEDGDLLGWSSAAGANGGGTTGVEDHSNSQMGYVYHHGIDWHSLTRDFGYAGESVFSFDMHAVAVKVDGGGGWKHASCGVMVSLLDTWNTVLGSFTLINATNSSWLVTGDVPIDDGMHHYSATMGDYASRAGLSGDEPISKISLKFFANADQWHPSFQSGWYDSYATVWFDNVNVVPEPATMALLGFGGLLTLRRKRKV